MKRGAVVTVAARGSYTGKPRPALVVQSDLFNATHASVTICPITSELNEASLFRIALAPGDRSGLKHASQVMVDKVVSVPRSTIGDEIGALDPIVLDQVDEALRRWLSL